MTSTNIKHNRKANIPTPAKPAPPKIEKGVPIPAPVRKPGHGRKSKYPFRDMVVGDSFLMTGIKNRAQPTAAMVQWRLRTGFTFTSRKISENTYRIWRVA